MVVLFNKTFRRLSNAECNYHDSLQARLIDEIGHWRGVLLVRQVARSAISRHFDFQERASLSNPAVSRESNERLELKQVQVDKLKVQASNWTISLLVHVGSIAGFHCHAAEK